MKNGRKRKEAMPTMQKPIPSSKQRAVEILLVEDNPGDARLIHETFKRSRFAVNLSIVSDGDAAMDYLNRKRPYHAAPRPDFILLDLNLPRKNGHEVSALIKSSRRLSGIPTLILTGSARDEDRWQAVQSRASAYLVKPVELNHYNLFLSYIEEKWMKDLRLDLPPGAGTSGI